MTTTLPTNVGQLIVLGNKMINGLNLDHAALGITQITAAQLTTQLAAFVASDNAFNIGRGTRQNASVAFQAADGNQTAWIAAVKGVLISNFGVRWSVQWAQAGFTNLKTAIPTTIAGRYALAGRLIGFFTANPVYQVAALGVTAAQGTVVTGAFNTAQHALTAADHAMDLLTTARDSAYTTLTDTMWSLIKILQATLNDDDPRWLDFGLQMPSTPSTPGQPVNLTAHSDDTGNIIVACDPVPLATRYRWRMLLVGVETDYRLVASGVDPMGAISGVAPGQTAQIIVQAVNATLQGVASDPILYSVPLGKAAALAKSASAPAREQANGKGNGNGHAPHGRAVAEK